jgi:alpha-N-arabinofuranosidase
LVAALSLGLVAAGRGAPAAPAAPVKPVAPLPSITVQADQPGAKLNPAMWGIFFEDINFGADGGLYAELVKNRSFEFDVPMMGWTNLVKAGARGSLEMQGRDPLNAANSHYLHVQVDAAGAGFGLSNEGFRGMGVRLGEVYVFSAFGRLVGEGSVSLRVELVSANGRVLGAGKVAGFGPQWKKLECRFKSTETDPKARLNVFFEGKGALDVDMVSLFPLRTWKNRPGGLRADVAQMLADLRPGFMRFPGGCIVEGHVLANRYQWKTTIGKTEERKLILNRWNDEFKHRPAPDYFQSFGLGFFEYFQFCEDIGAQPLPILNCGMACQFNSNELAPLDQLEPYLQDMLDLIEFANGPVTTPWGRKRAEMGHPLPFNLKLLGVGNEQWGPQYVERYERLAKVLKQKYPQVQLISSAGPDPSGEKFDFLWPKLRALNADLVDEHYYRPPAWFRDNAHRYDNYDRKGPKVFAGEYAAQSVATCSPENRNTWECALNEAAFMTGLERNGDVVRMASYAPLFGHVDGWQWKPNLIWFDNLRVCGTPNYYVQQMFARNRGAVVLPVQCVGAPGLFVSATRDAAGDLILKVVNPGSSPVTARIQIRGIRIATGTALVMVGQPQDENTLDLPKKVIPVRQYLRGAPSASAPGGFVNVFGPYSFWTMRLQER